MFQRDTHDRQTLDFTQGGYLALAAESFLTDRRASGLASRTIRNYRLHLRNFTTYCDGQALKFVRELTPDFLRRYLLLAESHNPGGVHGYYRTLRAFLRWLEAEEVMPPVWRNPIAKVKPPRVPENVLEPVPLGDVARLLSACKDPRDRAIFLLLLDTGARAQEVCSMSLVDVELSSGAITIPKSKSGKPRTVFVGRRTRRAVRAYLRTRRDNSPALFVSTFDDRLTYSGLRQILRRRARQAGIIEPTLHQFRRAFALNFLRNGGDVYALQRLMGHSDLSVLRRYLKLTDQDTQSAHAKYSPADKLT